MHQSKLKWALDLFGAILGLVLLAPLMLTLALLIYINMGKPIIFYQERSGFHGKPFVMYKFRTMRDLRDENGGLLPDDERLTLIGRFLRRTSLDELPELFNVLKGEMSLVGPRPLLMEYLDRYTPEQALRHKVKPGITGWAQINGRQAISFSKRLELDVWYVKNWCLPLDLKILLMTIPNVLKSSGVILGQDVNEVDDLGLSQGYGSVSGYSKEKNCELPHR
ncbi:MAG: sugar transferase [Actinobacteria bacterium]|nr:sugar transferase [Actinomycetota bacterium]